MTFDQWKSELCALFDAAGENWKGYGEEMLKNAEAEAREAYHGGVSPREMVESEFDAAR